jgi:tetratricopeptide (TPR) repeat protein
VIGIVQVGMQSVADRYSYIPLIGIFLLTVWGLAEVTTGWTHRCATLTILTTAVITACILTSWKQVSHWQNNTTLFTHAIASTDKNFIAHSRLGYEYEKQGRMEEAVISYKSALADNPFYGAAYGRLGKISYESGKLDDAIEYYYKELFVNPLSVYCRNNLGIALAEKGRFDEAIDHFSRALSIKPDFIQARENLERAQNIKNSTLK